MKYRTIKKCNGAISVMLALLLLPILSTVGLIVEGARLQNARGALEDLVQSAGMSTLGSYEKDLLSRFGLLAVGQGQSPETLYNEYLSFNADGINLLSLGEPAAVEPALPLSDQDILTRQIREFEKLRTPTSLAWDLIDIQGFFSGLQKQFEFGSKIFDTIGDTASAAENVKKLVEAIQDVYEKYTEFGEVYDQISPAYDAYRDAVDTLIVFLQNNTRPPDPLPDEDGSVPPTPTPAQEAWDDEYQAKKDAVNSNRDVYEDALADIGDPGKAITKLVTAYDGAISALGALIDSLGEVAQDVGDAKELKDEAQAKKAAADSGQTYVDSDLGESDFTTGVDGITEMADSAGEMLNDFLDRALILSVQTAYQETKERVAAYGGDDVAKTDALLGERDGYFVGWDAPDGSDLGDFVDQMAATVDTGVTRSVFSTLLDGLQTLSDISVLYDPYYQGHLSAETEAGLPNAASPSLSANILAESFARIDAGIQIFSAGELSFLDYLQAIGNILLGIVDFVVALVALIGEKVVGIGQLVVTTASGGFADNFLLAQYIKDTLPNRVKRGGSVFLPAPMSVMEVMAGNPLATDVSSIPGGADTPAFYACEQEYILYGGSSEVVNQVLAFFDIFIVRIILNIPAVLKDKGITKLMDAIPVPGLGIVLKILLVLIESFVDVVFLVNNMKVPFLKKNLYFSIDSMVPGESVTGPGDVNLSANDGLFDQLEELVDSRVSGVLIDPFDETELQRQHRESEEKKRSRQENDENKSETEANGFFNRKVDYSFYMWLLLLLQSNDRKVEGIGNVVEMEMDYCALRKAYGYEFQLERAYTQIKIQTKAEVTSLFPSFGAFGLFGAVESSEYMGY